MNIAEALQQGAESRGANIHTIYLDGAVGEDPQEGFFRLYPEAGNYRSYFIIRTEDVAGEVYELSPEERVSANQLCARVFRVPLPVGTTVMSVEVTVEKLGETVSGAGTLTPANQSRAAAGQCYGTTGCGHYPCCNKRGGRKCFCSLCCVA